MQDNAFTYTAFTVGDDRRTVDFGYAIDRGTDTYELRETLTFPVDLPDSPALHAALRALHIALGISYYKIFTSKILAHPYAMSESEAGFWNAVWRGGLGEFLYVNQLDPEALAQFVPQLGTAYEASDVELEPGALMGIGGGKDSAVAGEVLKQVGVDVQGFVMATGEQLGQTQAVAEVMGVPLQVVERRLDPQLLELQELPDAHKGHIPISLIFGLVGTVLAIANGKSYVVVANEASASIPRVEAEFGSVNHQWSKSFTFEAELQHYIHEQICPGITYFSAIRQLTSVGVAKLFATQPQYFEVFTSDNYVFRIDPAARPHARWSLESPKSLSSFILLSPWLSEDELLKTFGRDFLNELPLEGLFKELVGIEGEPPLDCVGTIDELVLSLNLAAEQGKFGGSYLMRLGIREGVVRAGDWQAELQDMLELQPDQALPSELLAALTDSLCERLAA